MAFPQPNSQRELTNRKILEELQLKKQMLLKQGAASPLSAAASLAVPPAAPAPALPMCSIPPVSALACFPQLPDANIVNTSQRAALHNAHATSCGFFVPQDSSFGNQILPVLPRFDSK